MSDIITPSILGNIAILLKGKTNPAKRTFFLTFIPQDLQQNSTIDLILKSDWISDGDNLEILHKIKNYPNSNKILFEMILALINDSPMPYRLDKISREQYQKVSRQIMDLLLINIKNIEDIPQDIKDKLNLLYDNLERDTIQSNEINKQFQEIIQELEQIQFGIEEIKMDLNEKFETFFDLYSKLESIIEDISNDIIEYIKDFDELQNFLIEKLGSDYEKIKDIWSDYKNGKVGKKELFKRIIKLAGPKALKLIKKFIL